MVSVILDIFQTKNIGVKSLKRLPLNRYLDINIFVEFARRQFLEQVTSSVQFVAHATANYPMKNSVQSIYKDERLVYNNNMKEEIQNYRKNHGGLRFGQDLWNKMNAAGHWEAPEANALFFVEDGDLAELLFKKDI